MRRGDEEKERDGKRRQRGESEGKEEGGKSGGRRVDLTPREFEH